MNLAKIALAVGSTVGARNAIRSVQTLGVDDVLASVGLARRPSTLSRVLPAIGWVSLGVAAGAGAALLLAPSSGKELRARVQGQLGEAKSRVAEQLHSVEQAMTEAVHHGNGGVS